MSAYALTPLARADIFDIWPYIAEDSEDGRYKRFPSITINNQPLTEYFSVAGPDETVASVSFLQRIRILCAEP